MRKTSEHINTRKKTNWISTRKEKERAKSHVWWYVQGDRWFLPFFLLSLVVFNSASNVRKRISQIDCPSEPWLCYWQRKVRVKRSTHWQGISLARKCFRSRARIINESVVHNWTPVNAMGKLSRQRERKLMARFKVNIMPLVALIKLSGFAILLPRQFISNQNKQVWRRPITKCHQWSG
jgi:hypothetical protein